MKKIAQHDIKDNDGNRYHIKIYGNNKTMPHDRYTVILYKYHSIFWSRKVFTGESFGVLDLEEMAKRTLVSYLVSREWLDTEKRRFYKWANSTFNRR